MKKRVWLCLLITVCMIVQMAVLPVYAVVPETDAVAGDRLTEALVPLQDDPSRKADLVESRWEPFVDTGDVSIQSSTVFETKEAAAKEVRKCMKARQESFSVCLKSKSSASEKMIADIMELALEHTGDPKEGDYLAWQLSKWSGSAKSSFWPWGYEHTITFKVTYYTTAEQESQVDTAVAQLLKELNVSGKGSYDKIKTVYSYICGNVTYDHDNLYNDDYVLKHTAYAAIVNKKAVCQGYALLMYRLLLELGVDNRMIIGVSSGENHAWNIAKIGELYYNLDATWDAGASKYDFFLRNRENFVDHTRYLEYESIAFHKKYPMSATDYSSGSAKVDPVIDSGTCGANARWQLNRDGSLTITGSGAIYDYAYLSGDPSAMAPWEFWEEEITKLTVGSGITEIGLCNFCDMTGLTSVSLPDSLERIGRSAFLDATALKNITIPGNVRIIEACAFDGCKELTSITLPNSVASIGTSCFRDCEKLKTVDLGTGLTEMGLTAFSGCTALERIELPRGLKAVPSGAFDSCASLKEITIPASVTEVVDAAFNSCSSLEKVVFEGSPMLGSDLFGYGNSALQKIYFRGDAPQFHVRTFDGVTATCYYPKDNATWTGDVMQDYCGSIKWVASCGSNHTPVKDKAVAATCTESGRTEGTHCSACGDVITPQKTIPALGHSFGQWKQVKEPSVSEEGEEQRACSRCGATESRSVAKLDSSDATVPTEPTTTEPTPTETQPTETTVPVETTVPSEPTVPEGTTVPATQPSQTPTTQPEDTTGAPTAAPGTEPTQPDAGDQEEPRSILPAVLIAGVVILAGAAAAWFFVLRKRK